MPFWPLQVYAYMYHREPNLGVHRENLTPGGWVLKEFVWEILFHCKTWMSIKLILKLKLPHLVSMCVSLPLQQFQCDPPIHPFITSFYGWSCMGNDDPNPNCHKPAVTENPATVTPKQIYTYPPPPLYLPVIARVWFQPQATWEIRGRPGTLHNTALSSLFPSPSCPLLFHPQVHSSPSSAMGTYTQGLKLGKNQSHLPSGEMPSRNY